MASSDKKAMKTFEHDQFKRCTLGLTLGDPIYSTSLLPKEKVRLTTADRRKMIFFAGKLSY